MPNQSLLSEGIPLRNNKKKRKRKWHQIPERLSHNLQKFLPIKPSVMWSRCWSTDRRSGLKLVTEWEPKWPGAGVGRVICPAVLSLLFCPHPAFPLLLAHSSIGPNLSAHHMGVINPVGAGGEQPTHACLHEAPSWNLIAGTFQMLSWSKLQLLWFFSYIFFETGTMLWHYMR